MKQITIFITLISLCFGGSKLAERFNAHIKELSPELLEQISKNIPTWKNLPARELNRSMIDPSELLGEWKFEDSDESIWLTVGTNQSMLDFMQIYGMNPANGGIGFSGTANDTLDYMYTVAWSYYGYDVVFLGLSNNPIDEDYYSYYNYEDYEENLDNVELPFYRLSYISYYGYYSGEFFIADTIDGEMVEFRYELGNISNFVSVDEYSYTVNISGLTVSNTAGDSTYAFAGTLTPGSINLTAGVPTEIPYIGVFSPEVGLEESMNVHFFEDGTGYDIRTYNVDTNLEWSDTTEFDWEADNENVSLITEEYDDYYGYDYLDTMTLEYEVDYDMFEGNTLILSAEIDYCSIMGDYYYYVLLECHEFLETTFGITDIQDLSLEFWMEMSEVVEETSISDVSEIQPGDFIIHQAYPNPFNPTTTLKYEMGFSGPLSIQVFDVYGKLVKTLYNGINNIGEHEIRWNAKDDQGRQVSSGVYLFKVSANGKTQTAKTLLLK